MSNNPQKTNLAERFSTFGSTPSDSVWNAIDAQLSAGKSKNRGLILWLTSNVAMIGLMIFAYSLHEKSAISTESKFVSTEPSVEESSEYLTTTKQNETPQSSEKTENASVNKFSTKTPTHAIYLKKHFSNLSLDNEKNASENLPEFDSIQKNQSSSYKALFSSTAIDSLQTNKLQFVPSNLDRNTVVCLILPQRKFRTFEIGARVATFSEIREWDQTLPHSYPNQTSSYIVATTDSNEYVHNSGHQRPFELEVFTRINYHRFYGTAGFSFARTNVEEIYGNSGAGVREFVSKEISSVGIPVSVGYNIIDRSRFQFALSARLIPEYSFLTSYEKLIDKPNLGTAQPPQMTYTVPEQGEATEAVTLGLEPHLSMNFKLNERFDVFGQFGYRTGLIRSPLFSNYFTPNFTTFSVGTVVRL